MWFEVLAFVESEEELRVWIDRNGVPMIKTSSRLMFQCERAEALGLPVQGVEYS